MNDTYNSVDKVQKTFLSQTPASRQTPVGNYIRPNRPWYGRLFSSIKDNIRSNRPSETRARAEEY